MINKMFHQQKQAKVILNGVMKRFNVPIKFEEFRKCCEKAHNLKDKEFDNYIVSYIDDEDDKVIISNEFDYDQALIFIENPNIQYLKINLEQKNEDESKRNSINYFDNYPDELNISANQANSNEEKDPLRSGMNFDKRINNNFEDNQNQTSDKKGTEEINNIIDHFIGEVLTTSVVKKPQTEFEDQNLQVDYKRKEQFEINKKMALEKLQRFQDVRIFKRAFQNIKKRNKVIIFVKKIIKMKEDFERKISLKDALKRLKENFNRFDVEEMQNQNEHKKFVNSIHNENGVSLRANEDLNNMTYQLPLNFEENISQQKHFEEIENFDNEETEKESRRRRIMDRIKKMTYEDILKSEITLSKENKAEIQIIQEGENGNENLIQQNLRQCKNNNIQKELSNEKKENLSVEENKKFSNESKKKLIIQLDEPFVGEPREVENQLKLRLHDMLQTFFEEKFETLRTSITSQTIENSNIIMEKYRDYLVNREAGLSKKFEDEFKQDNGERNQQKNKFHANLISHENIECARCEVKPIIGDRYKCHVCKDFNFCMKCEELNAITNQHPHSFIRIRKPEISPNFPIRKMYTNDNKNLFRENIHSSICNSQNKENENGNKNENDINYIQDNNHIIMDSSVFRGPEFYSSQCITENMETSHSFLDKGEVRKMIKLKNVGKCTWPKPCILICNREKSSVFCPIIPILPKIEPNDDINIDVKFEISKEMQPGKYYAYLRLYHSSSQNYFGDEFCLILNIYKPVEQIKDPLEEYNKLNDTEKFKYNKLVNIFRNNYGFTTNFITNEQILRELIRAKGDEEIAMTKIIEIIQFN